MIGALGAEGSTALMVIEGATHAAVFRAYVKHVLAPTLRPGKIVLMDNLSSHKSREIRAMIEAAGAELWYVPPYSPDLNPIDEDVVENQGAPPGTQGARGGETL